MKPPTNVPDEAASGALQMAGRSSINQEAISDAELRAITRRFASFILRRFLKGFAAVLGFHAALALTAYWMGRGFISVDYLGNVILSAPFVSLVLCLIFFGWRRLPLLAGLFTAVVLTTFSPLP